MTEPAKDVIIYSYLAEDGWTVFKTRPDGRQVLISYHDDIDLSSTGLDFLLEEEP